MVYFPKWLMSPALHLHSVSARLYGNQSKRNRTRLVGKLNRQLPFEEWELKELEAIRQHLLNSLLK